jgi:hypothetical protein
MDFEYVTFKEAFELKLLGEGVPLSVYKEQARDHRMCEVCGQPAWRYGGTGLCFTCTTGCSDTSEDYEIEAEYEIEAG